jgi:hypothetical protein
MYTELTNQRLRQVIQFSIQYSRFLLLNVQVVVSQVYNPYSKYQYNRIQKRILIYMTNVLQIDIVITPSEMSEITLIDTF